MIQARRLGYAVLSTSALDAQVTYFQDMLGLTVLEQTATAAVLATRCGVEAIVLNAGKSAALTGLSFQISSNISLDDAARSLRDENNVEAVIRSGRTPCVHEVVAFTDPFGMEIELFNQAQFRVIETREAAISPLKLGHVAMGVPDVGEASEYYRKVLGFRRSDWRTGKSEFLRCCPDHHTVNFFRRPTVGLLHIAFEMQDMSDLARASDYLRRWNYKFDWGPGRHYIGHNIACYHRNKDGVRIELYAEMDRMMDEELGYFEPRPWHQDFPQKPREWPADTGRNYWNPDEPSV